MREYLDELRQDIQTGGERYWCDLVAFFPESMKGECAKSVWSETEFQYGMEYGALAILNHLLMDILVPTKQRTSENQKYNRKTKQDIEEATIVHETDTKCSWGENNEES